MFFFSFFVILSETPAKSGGITAQPAPAAKPADSEPPATLSAAKAPVAAAAAQAKPEAKPAAKVLSLFSLFVSCWY
jgi:hypothetical protein